MARTVGSHARDPGSIPGESDEFELSGIIISLVSET